MKRTLFAVAALALTFAACKPATDLNTTCTLVKRNPDGGAPLPILERDVRDMSGANKDFIAVGSVQCEDLICVRDAKFTSDAGLDDPAQGYCSRQCAQGSSCPSYDEKLDRGSTALSCRPLLLSAETLALLKDEFPGVRDPYFCARSSDGGT